MDRKLAAILAADVVGYSALMEQDEAWACGKRYLDMTTFWEWRVTGFGALDPRVAMRDTIPASALMVGGMELMLASFLLSLIRWKSDER
jgi:hypothetical protein